ncbi:MAG TPA: metal ABC transporter permease [Mycobacteriales bacterium]|nr:metal ABC transporter permease [Mycobacteriales bacterium]
MSWLDSYVHRALLEAVILGATAGIVGVHVVLRRLSFFTMTMTHATFPGVVIAEIIGANIYYGGAVAGFLACGGITLLSRRRGRADPTAIGVVLAAGFALGVALLSARSGFNRDLSAFLVGSIITVSRADLEATAIVGAATAVVVLAIFKELIFGAFDPVAVRALGYPAAWLDLLVLLLIEAVIVVATPAIGIMLSIALIAAPAATGRLWTDRLWLMTAIAVGCGISAGVVGIELSERYNLAAGGTITLVLTGFFLVSLLLAPAHGVLGAKRRAAGPATGGTARIQQFTSSGF